MVSPARGVLGLGHRSLREVPLDRHGSIELDPLQGALDEDTVAGRRRVAFVACAGRWAPGR